MVHKTRAGLPNLQELQRLVDSPALMDVFKSGPGAAGQSTKYFAEAALFEDPMEEGQAVVVSVVKLVRRGEDMGRVRATLSLSKEPSIEPVDLELGDGPLISYFLHGSVGSRSLSKNSSCLVSLSTSQRRVVSRVFLVFPSALLSLFLPTSRLASLSR